MLTKEQHKIYRLERYHKVMNAVRDTLGGKCNKCGSKENLEIDHINRKNKEFSISRWLNKSLSALEKEIKKCQLLCKKCHQDKTVNELYGGYAKHGSLTMYTHHKCKCQLCRNKWNEYMKDYKRNKRLQSIDGDAAVL